MSQAQKGKRPRKKRKISFLDIAIVLVLVLGVGLLLYPTVSNKWNEMHMTRAIAGYTQAVEALQEADYTAIITAAREYNEGLKSNKNRFNMTDEEREHYNSLLNVQGNGIMGFIEIPSIKVKIPIYHTTDETVLQIAAGHLEGSSLPIGGLGTHSAISGHRGLTSATLFTHLDKLKEGDEFFIHILNETLRYQVSEINVVLPDEVDLMAIDDERDLCTLITCTPYGVNSHRLLVTGERTELPQEQTEGSDTSAEAADVNTEDSDEDQPSIVQIVVFGVLVLLVLAFVCFLLTGRSADKGDSSSEPPDITE